MGTNVFVHYGRGQFLYRCKSNVLFRPSHRTKDALRHFSVVFGEGSTSPLAYRRDNRRTPLFFILVGVCLFCVRSPFPYLGHGLYRRGALYPIRAPSSLVPILRDVYRHVRLVHSCLTILLRTIVPYLVRFRAKGDPSYLFRRPKVAQALFRGVLAWGFFFNAILYGYLRRPTSFCPRVQFLLLWARSASVTIHARLSNGLLNGGVRVVLLF